MEGACAPYGVRGCNKIGAVSLFSVGHRQSKLCPFIVEKALQLCAFSGIGCLRDQSLKAFNILCDYPVFEGHFRHSPNPNKTLFKHIKRRVRGNPMRLLPDPIRGGRLQSASVRHQCPLWVRSSYSWIAEVKGMKPAPGFKNLP